MSERFTKKLTEGMKNPFEANGMPSMELPAAFRDIAEKYLAACREGFEQVQTNAERANAMFGQNCGPAAKGVVECNMKALEVLHSNVGSAFDFYQSLLQAKTPSDVTEISSAYMRKQYEALTAQTKEITALAQSVATEGAKSMKGGS